MEESKLVSFEQAKALKRLGFPQDEELYHLHYMDNGMIDSHENAVQTYVCAIAVPIQDAIDWLKKEGKSLNII